jgi:hypothetical protein
MPRYPEHWCMNVTPPLGRPRLMHRDTRTLLWCIGGWAVLMAGVIVAICLLVK